jgi:hypothetical protein
VRIRSKIVGVAVAAALSAVGFAASAAPASASASEGIYMYQNSYGGGESINVGTGKYWAASSFPDLSRVVMVHGAPANDQISSIFSYSDYRYCVYSDAWYSGTVGVISPRHNYPTLWMNDTISSVRKC